MFKWAVAAVLSYCGARYAIKSLQRQPPLRSAIRLTRRAKALERWRRWLDLEMAAEKEQYWEMLNKCTPEQLSADGVAVVDLYMTGQPQPSYYDRSSDRRVVSITFTGRDPRQSLPDHKLSSGDAVMVSRMSDFRKPIFDGMVLETGGKFIRLAADVELQSTERKTAFFVMQTANPVTYNRLCRVIDQLREPSNCVGQELIQCLFERQLRFYGLARVLDVFDRNLNASQRQAVARCVDPRRLVSVIHGPPGTGKTQTLTEVITQCVRNGEKLLVCAPSNVAVDNMMERVMRAHPKIRARALRLGRPVRISPLLHDHTFEVRLHKKLAAESDGSVPSSRNEQQRRTDVARELIGSAQVVFSTLTSSPDYEFPLMLLSVRQQKNFDVCIIDECAQALEVACWMGLIQARRCVLAGDHKQLPPTVVSERAAEEGLSLSLMERLSKEFSGIHDQLFTLLNVQYRMNEHIMRWSSDTFYESQLTADSSVATHLLRDLDGLKRRKPSGQRTKLTVSDKPLVLVDTCGEMPEAFRGGNGSQQQQKSRSNPDEVGVVYLYVRLLVEQGVQQEDIAVISPYSGQVALLKRYVSKHYPNVAIRTVDGFQGQEREVVVMSFVRSNKHGNVGFLSDARRLNVAVTRARRQLCVVADVLTVQSDQCLRTLVEHIKDSNQALCIDHRELNAKLKWPLPFKVEGARFVYPQQQQPKGTSAVRSKQPKTSTSGAGKPKSRPPATVDKLCHQLQSGSGSQQPQPDVSMDNAAVGKSMKRKWGKRRGKAGAQAQPPKPAQAVAPGVKQNKISQQSVND